MSKNTSILFLSKAKDAHCARALSFLRHRCGRESLTIGETKRGTSLPGGIFFLKYDYIVSYLCQHILPEHLLKCATKAAINFHPAPPEYPGIGCVNFALYEGAATFGVTCHHMAATFDSGPIIATRRFPTFASDDIESLLTRTYDYQLTLFYDVMTDILAGKIPKSSEQWSGKRRTRKDLDALAAITPDLSHDEIARRIRATSFGDWQPRLQIKGFTFEIKR